MRWGSSEEAPEVFFPRCFLVLVFSHERAEFSDREALMEIAAVLADIQNHQ
jgi:hypothetical protein